MDTSQIGRRAWSCTVVMQDAGLSCFDYVAQLTLTLFLEIADRLTNLFLIKDKSLTDPDSLPPPDVIAAEIADDLEAALEQFTKIAARLGRKS